MFKKIASLLFLIIFCFMPFIWRVAQYGLSQPLGLISDAGFGLLIALVLAHSPRWLRIIIVLPLSLLLIATFELVAAMHRLPNWHDLQYAFNPAFLENSISFFSLSSSGLSGLLLFAALFSCIYPLSHRFLSFVKILPLVALLVISYTLLNNTYIYQGVVERYSPVHWLLVNATKTSVSSDISADSITLPSGLNTLDLDGTPLLTTGKARNVLIIALEGIPGLYYPDIARAIGMVSKETEMNSLAKSTANAMLIPDFAVHSHQTIRGLYSMLCGDFSKLSLSTPKAFELQNSPARAQDCLPAQMAINGWETHYLQGANLGFMSKDRVMSAIGFQQVHGNEWFSEPNPFPFEWGVVDSVFFQGARKYIADLQAKQQPWMLTLLTVGTHQPYAVPDEIADNYPSRKIGSVALLDKAVGEFIENLRRDKILENTLVIVTSDESHGSYLANWISSWGLAVILAPEQLPRIKKGGFGLVDVTASVLDYFGFATPPTIIGRSFFRDYSSPREMISYTISEHRWHTSDNQLYECADDGRCRTGKADSLLGEHALQVIQDGSAQHNQLVALSAALDNNLAAKKGTKLLKFASGEIRNLPETVTNEWADNLVGAQYIDFPEKSQVRVSIKIKAVDAPTNGIALKLFLKQSDCALEDIIPPEFPILFTGDEGTIEFNFNNPRARQSFSFHLVGEGKDAIVQLDEFDISIEEEDLKETT